MKSKVYDEVSVICRKNWDKTGDNADLEAGIGVACMLSYLVGVKPDLDSLSDYTGCSRDELERPFYRLLQSGVFSRGFNARGDTALFRGKRSDVEWRSAWAVISGLASGIVSRDYNRMGRR